MMLAFAGSMRWKLAPQRDLHQVRQGPREFHAGGTCADQVLTRRERVGGGGLF